MRSPRALLAMLTLGACAHPQVRTPAADPPPTSPAGDYRVRGDLFAGGLEERLAIVPRADAYSVVRATTDGSVTASGVGIAVDDHLYLGLGPKASNVDLVVLEVREDAVHGTWAYGGRGGLGSETWSARGAEDPFVGRFELHGTDAESGEPYEGTVVVTHASETYAIRWTVGDETCNARGIRYGETLVAIGEGETGTPSAGARLPSGDALLGVYERRGHSYEGSTTILRSGGGYETATESLERAP